MARISKRAAMGATPALQVKAVANNTYRFHRTEDGALVWRLHRTDVVTRHTDGTYTLNSGGWRTVTTKDRINAYSPARLFSYKGEWFLMVAGARVPFMDGMRVDANGDPIPH